MIRVKRVALVSRDAHARELLARYLAGVGFEIDESAELATPSAHTAIVMVDPAGDVIEAEVRSWMSLPKIQRVVVVTSKPSVLRELLMSHTPRLAVLAAPAFGWDVVDALRKAEAPGVQ